MRLHSLRDVSAVSLYESSHLQRQPCATHVADAPSWKFRPRKSTCARGLWKSSAITLDHTIAFWNSIWTIRLLGLGTRLLRAKPDDSIRSSALRATDSRGDRSDGEDRERWTIGPVELDKQPVWGDGLPGQSEAAQRAGCGAYRTIHEVPEPVELAVVVTPAPSVPGVIDECVRAGVKGAIVISAGFREIGQEGVELERQALEAARRGGMRLIGPNCLGVMRPGVGLNATFATQIARPGTVGFLSQSGALCTAILDWSLRVNVGFSAFVSVGSMLDVGWGDLIDYLGDDPETKCIVVYMESVGDARSFLSASREVALAKPIIVIKAGRTDAAAKAAASHTGALAGSDEVLDAAFRRVGVLRVNSVAEVFDMADVLAKQPRPGGRRLGIVTNAGGPGVLATDAL